MAIRQSNTQVFHDKVVEIASENLRRSNQFKVYANPGDSKNTRIGELYPDIIITPQNENRVLFIIEVETADSINANEAISQWKSYSNLGGTFYILVPIESKTLAQNLCNMYGIRAKFGTYFINNYNQLTINYE